MEVERLRLLCLITFCKCVAWGKFSLQPDAWLEISLKKYKYTFRKNLIILHCKSKEIANV